MLCPEENENSIAPMCRFTVKNEPDDDKQFVMKQEEEGIVESPNPMSHAENEMMHDIDIKKETIVKPENTLDEKVVKEQMKITIDPAATTINLQHQRPSTSESVIQMHLTTNDKSGSSSHDINEMNDHIIVDQCVLGLNITNWDIRDVKGNAKLIWDSGDSVKVEEEYLVKETIKPEGDQCKMNIDDTCNLTHGEELMTPSCERLGCNMKFKEQATLEPQHHENIFECGVCGKSFAKKYDFTIHKRTHTRQKPFECEVCEQTFAQKVSFTRH